MKTAIAVTVLLVLFFALTFSAATRMSGTCDEIAHHIPVGYVLLTKWDFKMDTSQPPLARYIMALPLKLFLDLRLPADKCEWRRPDRASFGRDFFYKYNTSPKMILMFSRVPIMITGLLCGLLLFSWTSSVYGDKAGLLSLFLYCLSPNIIAHSGLATTDIVSMFFMFLSVYSFWVFISKKNIASIIIAGLCLGMAQLSKYSSVLLYPTFLLVLFFEFPAVGKSGIGRLLLKFSAIVAVSMIVTWAGYGFEFEPLLRNAMRSADKVAIISKALPCFGVAELINALMNMPIPLGSHMLGLLGVYRHAHEGHATFFVGQWSGHGNIFYFLIAFIIKNPMPTLMLLIAGSWVLIKNRITATERIVLTTAAVYLTISSFGNLQIGIRHILPIYPMCFMIAGRGAQMIKTRYAKSIVALLLSWNVISTMVAWPNYLSYFNELIGGSKNGYRYLRDSNLDWGQDLPALSSYMANNEVREVVLEYFGESDPASYGVNYRGFTEQEMKTPGSHVYAVSAQYLENIKWTSWTKPTSMAGYSILIYDKTKKDLK